MKQEPKLITALRATIGDSAQVGKKIKRVQFDEVSLDSLNPTGFVALDMDGMHIRYVTDTVGNVVGINLANIHLDAIPNQLLALPDLAYLNLHGTGLTQLPPDLRNLQNLRLLALSGNHLEVLPPWLFDLLRLETLYLNDNVLRAIPPGLSRLRNLQHLFLYGNKLESFPSEILELSSLKELNLRNNLIPSIPNGWTSLAQLAKLNLIDNRIRKVPREIFSLPSLRYFPLSGNPLESPPLEIVAKGLRSVITYFDAISKEEITLSEVRILMVGDGGAGKTSLVKRITGHGFDPHESQTHGINIHDWVMNNGITRMILHVWDFGGQEIMHATHQFFLSERSMYLLVLDGRKEEDSEYWLKHIESFGGRSPILVVMNKSDEHAGYDLNRRFLQAKHPGIQGFHKVSCKSGDGIAELLQAMRQALSQIDITKTAWPKSWFEVKTHLVEETKDFITMTEYRQCCRQYGVADPSAQDTLVRFLHDLGAVVHFDDFCLRDTHVLNPHWLTSGVYALLNSEELAKANGVLCLTTVDRILAGTDSNRYPPDKQSFIVEMMKKFQLCYQIDSRTILVPDLLSVQEPEIQFDSEAALNLYLDYEFLPRSIMPRLIVKLNQDIKDNLCWRTGVVLQDKAMGTEAVLRADASSRRIILSVVGELRRDYLTIIRASLKSIHRTFEELRVLERLPMPDNPAVSVSYEHLLRLESKGIDEYIPEGAVHSYSVPELLGRVRTRGQVSEDDLTRLLAKVIRESHDEASAIERANELLLIQPNFMGLGININALVEKLFRKMTRQH